MGDLLEPKKGSIIIHLTGFDQFGRIKKNPSDELVNSLWNDLQTHPLEDSNATVQSCTVIKVSAIDALLTLQQLRQKYPQPEGSHTLWLHVGVNESATELSLEKFAYNEAHFRLPDNRGWQPQHQFILQQETKSQLQTSVDVEKISQELSIKHSARPSTDPGRYVCNWIYFMSLHLCSMDLAGSSSSLFVHIPLFAQISLEAQRAFLRDLINNLVSQLRSVPKLSSLPF